MSSPPQSNKNQKRFQVVRGFPFPDGPFSSKHLEDILDYKPHDGDVIITAYPKTGTTWLQYILLQIMSKGEQYPGMEEAVFKVVPFMEMTGVAAVDALKDPRIYRNHVPFDRMKINKNAKYITMYRNPADTLVSYFHFQQEVRNEKLDFDQFFEEFVTGNIAYGRYFEHVLSYYHHKDDPNLLFLSYEKLLADRRGGILKIAEFLGEEYSNALKNDESLFEKILEQTSFEYMKKNLSLSAPGPKKDNEPARKVVFFRKGTKGDGKNLLSAEQLKRLKDVTEEVMKGTDVANEWLAE